MYGTVEKLKLLPLQLKPTYSSGCVMFRSIRAVCKGPEFIVGISLD